MTHICVENFANRPAIGGNQRLDLYHYRQQSRYTRINKHFLSTRPFRTCIFAILLVLQASCSSETISISPEEAGRIGELVFQNECAGKIDCLTTWNEGEEFASLGIGHFIWYPAGKDGPFEESFPKLLRFMQGKGVRLLKWISPDMDCPWPTRAVFMHAQNGQKMIELTSFLANNMQIQAEFMSKRLINTLPKMLASVAEQRRGHIRKQFYRVARSPMGMYVLVDYVNFKGEGSNPGERYNGKGWGLLQVLEIMEGEGSNEEALRAFAKGAEHILARRVQSAPKARNEGRWLPGWKKRLQTYGSSE